MTRLREGSFISEFVTSLAIASIAAGVVGVFILFWLPLIAYSYHYWFH